MVDNLKRFRQPLTWAAVLIIVASMVLSIVRLVVAVTTDQKPVFAAFQDIANSAMNLTLVFVLVALVCSCLFVSPPTPDAKRVLKVSAIVVSAGTLLTIVAMVIGVQASAGVVGVVLEFLGGLLDFILKAIASITLWLVLRAVSAGRMGTAAAVSAAEPELEVTPGPARQPATWEPSAAAGQVWRTAKDAASGQAPTSATGERPGAAEASEGRELTSTPEPAPRPASTWRRVEKSDQAKLED